MKILITGNQGFIGTYLEKYLSKLDHEVIGLDIKSGNDILVCELPNCDVVIHLAGIGGVRESISDPAKYWRNNVEGTRRILEYYKNIRVLVASSSSQYEPHLNPYAASKYVIEQIPHDNVVFMRLHTVYAETPRPGMLFYKLMNNELTYVTDHHRDFVYIDDVCDAIKILITEKFKGSLDIGSGIAVKISDLCYGYPLKTETVGERQYTCADLTFLKLMGFNPTHRVTEFVQKLRR